MDRVSAKISKKKKDIKFSIISQISPLIDLSSAHFHSPRSGDRVIRSRTIRAVCPKSKDGTHDRDIEGSFSRYPRQWIRGDAFPALDRNHAHGR